MKLIVFYVMAGVFILSCSQNNDKKTARYRDEIDFSSIEKLIRQPRLVKPAVQKHTYLTELVYLLDGNTEMIPPRGNVEYFTENLYSQVKNDSGREVTIERAYQFWYNRNTS